MILAVIFLSAALALCGGLLIGCRIIIKEQAQVMQEARRDAQLARDEMRAMVEAVARASRVPILKSERKPLEKLETYYEQKPTLEKISAL